MGKICTPSYLRDIHGKVGSEESEYFRKTPSGKTSICHMDMDYWENRVLTDGQKAATTKFSGVSARVKEIMANATELASYKADFRNQKKYKTLRGFIFAKVYPLV